MTLYFNAVPRSYQPIKWAALAQCDLLDHIILIAVESKTFHLISFSSVSHLFAFIDSEPNGALNCCHLGGSAALLAWIQRGGLVAIAAAPSPPATLFIVEASYELTADGYDGLGCQVGAKVARNPCAP